METDLQVMSDSELRAEVGRLRTELGAVDDWANGVYSLLVEVLPFLLRGHPEVEKIQSLLQQADDRYEELRAHPERAEEGEPAGLYEARKMANRRLSLLGVWPNVDPADAARRSLARAQRRERG